MGSRTKGSLHHLIVAELHAMLAKFCGSLSVILKAMAAEGEGMWLMNDVKPIYEQLRMG